MVRYAAQPTLAASSTVRERDTVLSALELLRALGVPHTLNASIIFLYICENEGLNATELAQTSRLPLPSACKIAAAFAREGALPNSGPLIEFRGSSSDRRLKLIHLTAQGRSMRDELDRLILNARTINPARN